MSGQAPSVFGMLLRLTFEKMAKAALLRSRQISIDGAQRNARRCRENGARTPVERIHSTNRVPEIATEIAYDTES